LIDQVVLMDVSLIPTLCEMPTIRGMETTDKRQLRHRT